MRILAVLLSVLGALPAAAEERAPPRVPGDIAAMHPEGKWKVRKRALYLYLVRYNGEQPAARTVLPDYMKLRLIQDRAHKRKIRATKKDVDAWLDRLDRKIRKESGGRMDLEKMRRNMRMTM